MRCETCTGSGRVRRVTLPFHFKTCPVCNGTRIQPEIIMTALTDEEIKAIAIAVRENVTRRWHHPDWNYMYYDQFEKSVADGIKLALKKAEVKHAQTTGPG